MTAPAAAPERPGGPLRARRRIDPAPALLALLALLARRPASMLRAPFWVDEAWVAHSVLVPFGALRRVTLSTPIGWTALLRLVPPVGPPERLRLVPLLFAALTAPLAYLLARELDPGRRLPALVTGVAVAVFPGGLYRHDLKQYTADAAVALLLVWLGARAERQRDRRSLALLAGVAGACGLVSHTTVFVAAAVFTGLVLAALGRWALRHAAEAAAAGLAAAAALGLLYLAFARPAHNAALRGYWDGYYVPDDGAWTFLRERVTAMLGFTGFGHLPSLALLLLAVVLLWRAGRVATALVLPVLSVVVLVAGEVRLYPLWEKRTGLFYFVLAAALAAYAVGSLAAVAARRTRGAGAVVVLGVAAAALAASALPAYRSPAPFENSKGFVAHLAAHAAPQDGIVVDRAASYGFAFYWRADRPRLAPRPTSSIAWIPDYGAASRVHVVPDLTPEAVGAALDRAAARGGAVWIVLTHPNRRTVPTYERAAAARGTVETVRTDGGVLLRLVPRR